MKRILLALLLIVTAACSHLLGPDEDDSYVGTYQLQSMGGLPLPFDGFEKWTLTLTAEGTHEHVYTQRRQTGTHNESVSGTYTVSGNTISFWAPDGAVEYGTYRNGQITYDKGILLLFKKD